MDPSSNLSKIGFAAGLRFFTASFIGLFLGFIGVFVLAFSNTHPANSYAFGFVAGTIVGMMLAAKYLKRNNASNYLLITILSASFGVLVPAFGGLIAFPILTSALGKSR